MVAPSQELAQGSAFGASGSPKLESSLHLQGAVAVSGEATLWKNSPDRNQWPQTRRSTSSPFGDDFQAGRPASLHRELIAEGGSF